MPVQRQYAAHLAGRTMIVPVNEMKRQRRAEGIFVHLALASLNDNDTFIIRDNTVENLAWTFEINKSGAYTPTDDSYIEVDLSSTSDVDGQLANVISKSPARYSAVVSGTNTITISSYDAGVYNWGTDSIEDGTGSPISSITQLVEDDTDLELEDIYFGFPAVEMADLPGQSTTTGVLSGSVWYYFTYYDAKHNSEGPILCPASMTALDDNAVQLDLSDIISSAPDRATHIKIYRSPTWPDGTNDNIVTGFNLVAVVGLTVAEDAAETYTDNTADSALANITLSPFLGAPPVDLEFVYTHNNRIWGVKEDRLSCSDALNPDNWNPENQWLVGDEAGQSLTCLVHQNDVLLAFKRTGMFAILYDTDPREEMFIQPVLKTRGCLNPKCAVDASGQTFILDSQGVYVFEDLARITPVSGKIQEFIDRMNPAAFETFSAVTLPDRVIFFVALDDDTQPQHALVFDLNAFRGTNRDQRWHVYHTDHQVVDSTMYYFNENVTNPFLRNKLWPVVIDEYGQPFALHYLESEGVPSPLISYITATTLSNPVTNGRITITPGADGRGFDSANYSYDATNLKVRLLLPSGKLSEPATIATVTSNSQVELDRPLTTEELTGTHVVVGAIDWYFQSGTNDLGDILDYKEAREAILYTTPMPFPGAVDVRFERDRSGPDFMSVTFDDSKYVATKDREGFVVPVGGALNEGGRGIQDVPIGGRFHYISYRLSGYLPNRPYRINGLEIEKNPDPKDRRPSN